MSGVAVPKQISLGARRHDFGSNSREPKPRILFRSLGGIEVAARACRRPCTALVHNPGGGLRPDRNLLYVPDNGCRVANNNYKFAPAFYLATRFQLDFHNRRFASALPPIDAPSKEQSTSTDQRANRPGDE